MNEFLHKEYQFSPRHHIHFLCANFAFMSEVGILFLIGWYAMHNNFMHYFTDLRLMVSVYSSSFNLQ